MRPSPTSSLGCSGSARLLNTPWVNCRAVERNKYWNELETTRHKFFRIMAGDFRTQLRIPRKFTSNFREELPKTISLRGPSDSIWKVRLTRVNGDVILCSGWNEFVEDHNISETDFLLFHYAGNATFSVAIFDASCCEREGAYFIKNHTESCLSGSCELEKKDEEPKEMKRGGVSGTKQNIGRGMQIAKSVGSRGIEKGKAQVEEPAEKQACKAKRKASTEVEIPSFEKGASNVGTNMAEESGEGETSKLVDEQGPYKKVFISNRRPVNEEEKKKAMWSAICHRSARPCFQVVMKATSASKFFALTIPKDWASHHIPKGLRRVELRIPPKREKWTVRLHQAKNNFRLAKGWHKFVWDNNLEQDDACVFELCEGGTSADRNQVLLQFNVIIYRVVDDVVPLTEFSKRK